MAIEKNNFKVSRIDSEYSLGSRGSMSTDEDEFQPRNSAIESDEDDFDDVDSGAGSDDFDLLELGETGAEYCQIGNQSCAVPFELYDLPDLCDILSLDSWNDCLSEEERFNLARYLPDIDHFSFMLTLKDLLSGCDFHFGSPISKLFDMLKGGYCEPRVVLYRQTLDYFQRRQHYHQLKVRQDSLVGHLCQMRDAWKNCKGYSIEERLQVLNIGRSQKSLMYEEQRDFKMDSDGFSEKEESDKVLLSKPAKDKRVLQKSGQRSAYEGSPTLDFQSRGNWMPLDSKKIGKKNPKGLLKLAGSRASSMIKPGSCDSMSSFSQKNKSTWYDSRLNDQMRNYNVREVPVHNISRGSAAYKSGVLKLGKHQHLRGENFSRDSPIMRFPNDVSAATDSKRSKKGNAHTQYAKKIRYSENQSGGEDHLMSANVQSQHSSLMSSAVNLSDVSEPILHGNIEGETFYIGPTLKYDEWYGGDSHDPVLKSFQTSSVQMNDRMFNTDYRIKTSVDKISQNYRYNGELDRGDPKSIQMLGGNEESVSGSSEPDEEGEQDNHSIRRKFGHPSCILDSGRSSLVKSGVGSKKFRTGNKQKKSKAHAFDERTHSFRTGNLGEDVHMGETGRQFSRAKKKGKMRVSSHLQRSDLNDHEKGGHKSGKKKNNFVKGSAVDDLNMSALRAYSAERNQRGNISHDFVNEEDDSLEKHLLADGTDSHLLRISQNSEACVNDYMERFDVPLVSCNSETKRKWNDDVASMGDGVECQQKVQASKPCLTEMVVTDEIEIKPQKKAFTLITPTVHTGFSFSIIHLLSAVRIAMITPHLEDALDAGNHCEKYDGMHMLNDASSMKHDILSGLHYSQGSDINIINTDHSGKMGVPSLTVHEIVNRVWSNPGDPCILETQEPLQDLVRGVLKVFSSRTAPLGAKHWKALVVFEKSTKSWSWIGPISQSTLDQETIEEVTAPDSWGLPHRMLVKLVDSFANWLKSSQETLQQIGSLPAPPIMLTQFNLDEKERFKDLRAQKSLNTISPSSEEVRDYFRREEFLRYSVPDRAFSYTAADGRKSIVAPLRRCGGKPTSKARDHFMLKRDRPPHVTILCLVRDAAGRLPGSIGTRADVCTLIRDSQYIVEDISDAQVNQVVSGALDRLHYERDPCVQFDGERKLWVYLHRDREEEDFEDDGTSSTKKWKRPKKDVLEQFDQGTEIPAYDGTGERTDGGASAGFDLTSDLNVEPLSLDGANQIGFLYDAVRGTVKDNGEYAHVGEQDTSQRCNEMVWGALGLNTLQDRTLLCQENSANEDFCDEAGKPVGFFGAALL